MFIEFPEKYKFTTFCVCFYFYLFFDIQNNICTQHVVNLYFSEKFNEQFLVILWVNWFKNESFWHRFTCNAADVEFEKVIKSIKSFKDVKKLLNANKKYLQIFPEDEIIFVSRILPIMKKQPNSCLPIQFVNQVSALENSLTVANHFKTNLMKKPTTHFFINCCSDPIKPIYTSREC